MGEQSLLLDATRGRAIVQNGLKSLSALEDGLTISFELLILKDAHVNFQLVKESRQGLTADFVGWEQGRILAYKIGAADSVASEKSKVFFWREHVVVGLFPGWGLRG